MQHVHQFASGRGLAAGLPIIPAQRAIRPLKYSEPRRVNDRALVTCSGLVIGGAIPVQTAPVMSADAIAIQAALTDRRADTPRLIDEVRGFAHELRTDPKLGRRVRSRLFDIAVRPLIAWC